MEAILHAIQYNSFLLATLGTLLTGANVMLWQLLRYRKDIAMIEAGIKEDKPAAIAEVEVLKIAEMHEYALGYEG